MAGCRACSSIFLVGLFVSYVTSLEAQVSDLESKWSYQTPWLNAQAVVQDPTDANLLHVAYKGIGIRTIRIQGDGIRPDDVAQINAGQLKRLHAMNLFLDEKVLYVALGDFFARNSPPGLAAISLEDPTRPTVLSTWKSEERPDQLTRGSADVLVHDGVAYLAAMSKGVKMLNVSNPSEIKEMKWIDLDKNFPKEDPDSIAHPNARGLAIQGQYLYVAYDAGGLRVVDISDPNNPVEKWKYLNAKLAHRQQAYNDLVIHENLAFVSVDYGGMEVLDISRPNAIRQIAWWNPWDAHSDSNTWFNSPGHTNQIHYDAARKLVFMSTGDSELVVVDVNDLERPALVAQFGGVGNREGAWGVAVDRNFETAYLTYINALYPFHSGWSGVKGIDITKIRLRR